MKWSTGFYCVPFQKKIIRSKTLLYVLCFSKNFELLSTRAGRAGVIHNFMRGLSLQQSYPLSPFSSGDSNGKCSMTSGYRVVSDRIYEIVFVYVCIDEHRTKKCVAIIQSNLSQVVQNIVS